LLTAIYAGEDSSVECLDKLFSGVEEPVDEGLATYARIKEISLTPVEKLYTMHQEPESKDDETVPAPKQMPQISFLQEEDDDDEEEIGNEEKGEEENKNDYRPRDVITDDQQPRYDNQNTTVTSAANGHGVPNKNVPKDNKKTYRKRRNTQKKKQESS
jgi:hypothetical protein